MRRSILAPLVIVLAACGGSDADTPSPERPALLRGRVDVVSTELGTTTATASFARGADPLTPGCTWVPTQPEVTSADAGAIRILLPGASRSVTLAYDGAASAYAPIPVAGAASVGFVVHVDGLGGDDVPPFAAELRALDAPVLLEPLAGDRVATDAALPVTWRPRTDAPIVIRLDMPARRALCVFDPALGHAEIPADVIKAVFATSDCGPSCPALHAFAVRGTNVRAGDYDVRVEHWAGTTRYLQH